MARQSYIKAVGDRLSPRVAVRYFWGQQARHPGYPTGKVLVGQWGTPTFEGLQELTHGQ